MGHFIRQRAAAAGMTSLLSAPISLERHQIEVIRQVLQDPVQRYLLADEVGLGKTVEAGVIIRQHILDHPLTHRVLVIVPEELAEQWDAELNMRCQVGAEFGHCITIITFEMLAEWDSEQPDLVVVDEAHRAVQGWSDDKSSKLRVRFERLRQLSAPILCPRLLLLSATPIRRNEKGFLALLHLLDPAIYPLDDVAAFEARVAKRQELADLFTAFTEDQQVFFLENMVDRLAELFPNDHRLSKLLDRVRPHLAFDAQVDEAELRAEIRAVRLHLSESYRLHRRLLRNRRTEEVEGLLPGRAGLTLVSWNDGTMPRIEGLLDAWRSRAAAAVWSQEESPWAKGLAQLFNALLEAAWGDAGALMACLEARLTGRAPEHLKSFGSLTQAARMDLLTQVPKFEGEVEILQEIARLQPIWRAAQKDRITTLRALASELLAQGYRIVCIATSPALADQLYESFHAKWRDKVVRHNPDGTAWRRAWTNAGASILVCDARAEEGVNLQGGLKCMIHVDLPLSPNRLEHRIGRLDRFGVGKAVPSFVLQPSESGFWTAWTACLDEAWEVFSRSIAALQYLVEDEMRSLRDRVFLEGAPAITYAAERLRGPEGSIAKEFRAIRNQDELDSLQLMLGGERPDLLTQLETNDATADEFQKALEGWLVDRLQFMKVGETQTDGAVLRYHYRRSQRGKQTLMAQQELLQWFSPAIDASADNPEFGPPLTRALAYRRETARHRGVGLARLGNPVIDGVHEHLQWDDRGTCFALWRQSARLTTTEIRACFRFDFIVEANLDALDEWLKNEPALSFSAVRRKADGAFPPIIETVWIDQDLQPLSNECLEDLERPLRKEVDWNVNQDRWPLVLERFGTCQWSDLCESVRRVAEELLRRQHDLAKLTQRFSSEFEEVNAIVREQGESRFEALAQDIAAQAQLRLEMNNIERIANGIANGIRVPKIRLDAAGVVLLAGSPLIVS